VKMRAERQARIGVCMQHFHQRHLHIEQHKLPAYTKTGRITDRV
jgi:hypothetical protein